MANESFKEIKLVVRSKNGSKPVEWNDSELNLFSERFMEYLLQEGKDPRIEPQDYLRWYCTQMDRFDIEEGISGELEEILGEDYDKEIMNEWDVDSFIALLARKNSFADKSGEVVLGQGEI